MESFFALLQRNALYHRRWSTGDGLLLAISPGSNTPTTYDGNAALGNLTRIEFETLYQSLATAAESPKPRVN